MTVLEIQYQIDPIVAVGILSGWATTLYMLFMRLIDKRKEARLEVQKKVQDAEYANGRLERTISYNQEIYQVITNLCVRYQARTCYLLTFSNGGKFFNDISKVYMSITHEWTLLEETPKRGKDFQNKEITGLSHRIMYDVLKHGHVKAFVFEDIKDPEMKEALKSFDVRAALYMKVTDGRGNMCGMLVFHWNDDNPKTYRGKTIDSEDILRIENHHVKTLENIFLNNA